ncbi:MAG: MFS transporter [Acidimicrobiales bacterium]|nr:MAG: MFS transporter [Acidimicrobiales bacterium]
MAADDTTSGRFDALREPDYKWLWWGGVFVFLASQAQQVARGWLAYELTGNNRGLGGVIFGFGVSSLIAVPVSGVVADRFSKRKILVLAQSAMALAALGIALAVVTDTVAYWMLIAASVVQGTGMSFLGPARLAMTADLIDRRLLTNAIFLSNASIQATRVIGPVVAGVLIAVEPVGIGGVYFIGTALAALSVLTVARVPAIAPRPRTGRSGFGDLADGIAYVRRNKQLQRLLVIGVLVVMVGFPHITLLPGLVEDDFELDAWAFGALTASAAIGAVTASLALANVHVRRLGPLQFRAGVLFAVSLAIFAAIPIYWPAAAVMVFVGAASSAFQAMNNSQVLTIADVEYHGRVQSLMMLAFTGFGLAALPVGLLADAYGIREVMVGEGVLIGLVVLGGEAWRRRDAAPEVPLL